MNRNLWKTLRATEEAMIALELEHGAFTQVNDSPWLRFLAFGGNGDLRNSLFFTIGADCAQDFLFGNLSDILRRLS